MNVVFSFEEEKKINGAFVLVKIGQDHPPSIRRSDALISIMIVFGLSDFVLGLLVILEGSWWTILKSAWMKYIPSIIASTESPTSSKIKH